MSSRKKTPVNNSGHLARINQNSLARSTNNLSSNNDSNNRPIDFRSVTLSRNGSMPNLERIVDKDKETQLMLEYDRYLSSVTLKYIFERCENKITTNINKQTNVFKEELVTLYEQISTLSEELKRKNELKIEKENMDEKLKILEMLNKNIVIDDLDGEIFSTLNCTASKVVLKNFKEMNEADFRAVKCLLNEIAQSLKELDYENKIKLRIQLKDLLIKAATLINDLDLYKLKCEELSDKIENLQNYNSSLKILNAQFGENPNQALLPIKGNLMEEIKKEFDII